MLRSRAWIQIRGEGWAAKMHEMLKQSLTPTYGSQETPLEQKHRLKQVTRLLQLLQTRRQMTVMKVDYCFRKTRLHMSLYNFGLQ